MVEIRDFARAPPMMYTTGLHAPVVHDSKLAVRWHKLQGPLCVKAIQGDALMEIAVVQHDGILGGATPVAIVMAMSASPPTNCQRVIERQADGWIACKVALDLQVDSLPVGYATAQDGNGKRLTSKDVRQA